MPPLVEQCMNLRLKQNITEGGFVVALVVLCVALTALQYRRRVNSLARR
jgi:hypothetical protein